MMPMKVKIKNMTLLCSAENYVQIPIINENGEEYLKKDVYVCKTESLCCTVKLTQRCKSTILQFKKKY